ncbi:MAG: hypothetical protein KAQ69_12760, partial [Spirochaetales bacterium]|nr:hypothetical protein [Spirochaetales bacterium]
MITPWKVDRRPETGDGRRETENRIADGLLTPVACLQSARVYKDGSAMILHRSFRIFSKTALVIMILMLFTGCSTYFEALRAEIEGWPLWIIQTPPGTLQNVFFVGMGTDVNGNKITARQNAIEDMLQKISQYLKYTIPEEYRREILTTYAIREIALRITDEYTEEIEENGIRSYLLAESDRKIVSKLIRDNLEITRAASQLIDQPAGLAETAYFRKDDFSALVHYIDAAVQAYTSSLENADDLYQDIMHKTLNILRNLVMQEAISNPSSGTITLQITRGDGLFAPKIPGITLRTEYPIKNSAGKTLYSELFMTTDSNGEASFSTDNPYFRGQGIVTIHLDISDLIQKLETVTGPADPLLMQLKEEAAKFLIEFPFSLVSSSAGGEVVFSLLEYELNGTLINGHPGMERMAEVMLDDGIMANSIFFDAQNSGYDDDNSDESILMRIREEYEGLVSVAVFGIVGISGIVQGSGGYIASAKGSVRAVYLATGLEIDSSGELVANGYGSTKEAAKTTALSRFGEIAASRILSILF